LRKSWFFLKSRKVYDIPAVWCMMYKRASTFIYSRVYYLEPTEIIGEILSKTSSNDRLPGRLRFFDTSRTRIGRVCISNAAKYYSENWKFDFVSLSVESFKFKLHEQFLPQPRWNFLPNFTLSCSIELDTLTHLLSLSAYTTPFINYFYQCYLLLFS